jgi:hypothetical protein
MTKGAKRWSTEQREFMAWLAMPRTERTPVTQLALAKELGVHYVTLSKWRYDPRFIVEVNNLKRPQIAARYPEIIDALIEQAERGSYQHQKTYLELIGEYKPPKQEVELSGGISMIEVILDAEFDDDSNG